MFTHEKFKAYQEAVLFIAIAINLIEQLPRNQTILKDQLKRAAFSIPLNIAEGTGKTGQADRKRFYSIARGSAMECAAICDIIGLTEKNLLPYTKQAKKLLISIVNVLSAVCMK